jgi:hypothetical protein
MDEDDVDPSTTDQDTAPKLRTFRGWKRDTAHLDKARLTKGLLRSQVTISLIYFLLQSIFFFISQMSSEPAMTYDATKEMNEIFRTNR